MGDKVREKEAGRVGAQHVPQLLPKTLAERKILVLADARQLPPMGSVLFLP
jgi:hypothetical protein